MAKKQDTNRAAEQCSSSEVEGLLREIAYYEKKAAAYDQSDTAFSRALARIYRYSAFKKRLMLSAMEGPASYRAVKFPY